MRKNVVAFDCDGVLIDSNPELIKEGISRVGEIFPIKQFDEKKLKELVVLFGGEGFASGVKKALELLFPGKENEEKREKCLKVMMAKRIEIYERAKPFPGALETVKKLAKSYHLVISSGLERIIIDKWLKKNGLGKFFEEIYSLESGEKETHPQLIRARYPNAKVFYVGDSIKEMKLGDFSIGVARETWHQELLLKKGAKVVISSLKDLETCLV